MSKQGCIETSPECINRLGYEIDQLKALVLELQKGCGGFLWLGQNLHNIEQDPVRFKELYQSAMHDAKVAYDKAEKCL